MAVYIALLKFISINIIAAISWLHVTFDFTTFPPRLLKAAIFFLTAWLFLSGFHFFFVQKITYSSQTAINKERKPSVLLMMKKTRYGCPRTHATTNITCLFIHV